MVSSERMFVWLCLQLARLPMSSPHAAAEELPRLTGKGRPASEARTTDRALLEAQIFEGDVQKLDCPCNKIFGTEKSYYVFDTSGEIPSGLNHQQSNLKAILTEGLSLGRSVLLRKPTLTRAHNYDRRFRYNMWGDFIAFNASSFTLSSTTRGFPGRQKKTCTATLAQCVTDASETQLLALTTAPHTVIPYHNGTVDAETNRAGGLLIRGPESSTDKVALVRKLPGFPAMLGSYQLRLRLAPPPHVAAAVPPVTAWLQSQSTSGHVAVVHVRRGDKIQKSKYCPNEMRLATAPENIASVLDRAGIPPGSAIYIMSDETNFNHFKPLVDTYNYHIATNVHFDHLHSLIDGCNGQQQDLPCENYLLFAIEKEIFNAVPPSHRFVTLPRHDLAHNKNYLMHDFLGPGKPCASLRRVRR